MRICIVTDFSLPHYMGGGERRYYEILKRLAARGHTIDLVCMKLRRVERYEYVDGINVYHIGPTIKNPPKRTLADFLRFLAASLFWLLRHDYDLIEANPWISMLVVSIAARLKRTRSSAVIHDLSSGKPDQWISFSGLAELFEKLLIRLPFDKIICVSNKVKSRLIREYNLRPDKIAVFYDGVDLMLIDSVSIAKKEKNTLAFVGRLVPHKHVDDLIKAVKLLKKEIPTIKLKVIGTGQELDNLRSLVTRLKLADNVSLLGAVPDKEKIKELKRSNLFVLPSTREGFGIVLVEAFASRIPCIAYSSDGVVEVIDDGINGFLVKQRDIKGLAEKIRVLLKDKKKATLFARRGREKTERLFDWDKISEEIERFYLALVKPK